MDVRWRWETRAGGTGGSGREITNPEPNHDTTSIPIAEPEGEAPGESRPPQNTERPPPKGGALKKNASSNQSRLQTLFLEQLVFTIHFVIVRVP